MATLEPSLVTDSKVVFVKKDWAYLKLITITSDSKVTIQDAINCFKEEPDYPEWWADWSYTKDWPKANYSEDITWQTIQLYMIDVVQVSKKVQKLMNNWEEYVISGWDLPSWGTTWQVLTKTETWAEWKDFQGGIASDTITWIWWWSAEDYDSVAKEEWVIYFVKE